MQQYGSKYFARRPLPIMRVNLILDFIMELYGDIISNDEF